MDTMMDKTDIKIDILKPNPLDYSTRKLDICGVCKLKYNIGDRIPRILVNCGHTYCTSCLTKYYRKQRIRCPCSSCKKLVKNLESVEQLPLNITIFGEIVQNDPLILLLIDSEGQNSYTSICNLHEEKQKHFFCSFHETNFCRECIKLSHTDDKCCVIDLCDISKLFLLNEQNIYKNSLIVKTRNRSGVAEKNRMNEEFFLANS